MLRFNHIELTVPRGFVAAHADDIVEVFGTLFSFRRRHFGGLETPHFLLSTDQDDSQFIFICESPRPIISSGDDHLGFHLDDNEAVDACLSKCTALQVDKPLIEIRQFEDLDLSATITRSFYVKYLLPIWFDVQTINFKAGHEPSARWYFAAL